MRTRTVNRDSFRSNRSAVKLILFIACLCVWGVLRPATAMADELVASNVVVAADDFVINVYHNGQIVPDTHFKLENEIYGATVMRIRMDIHPGDWIVFEVANDRFRWDGNCAFAAAGLKDNGQTAFASDTDSGHWSACDSTDKASHFISDAAYGADSGVVVPRRPWTRAADEVRKLCPDWQGKIIWCDSDARHIWIKFALSAVANRGGGSNGGSAGGAGDGSGDNNATGSPQTVATSLAKGAGTAKSLARTQSSIHALYVLEEDNGGMLGLASNLILTATPGEAAGDTIPVDFGTDVGSEMQLVLEDVLRVINRRYSHLEAQKFEFTFEDKYSGHDGGSIGAAIGTLMLSVIDGFDIDPQLAMTGDVSADGRVHAIGGVPAKLRGAKAQKGRTAAGGYIGVGF